MLANGDDGLLFLFVMREKCRGCTLYLREEMRGRRKRHKDPQQSQEKIEQKQ